MSAPAASALTPDWSPTPISEIVHERSSHSARLGLPYVAAGQLQKHVTVNEALARLDTLIVQTVRGQPDDDSRAGRACRLPGRLWTLCTSLELGGGARSGASCLRGPSGNSGPIGTRADLVRAESGRLGARAGSSRG
jgi:hypothetical protein